MSALPSLLRLEIIRLLSTRRWVIVALAGLIAAFLASDSVRIAARVGDVAELSLTASAWDVHAAAANSLMYVGYLLFTAFIFLVGDRLLVDRDGYGQLVLARCDSRAVWWSSKVAVIVLCSVAVQALFLMSCLLVGVAREGLTIATTPSEFATFSENPNRLFAPVALTTNMGVRQLGVSAYLALAFSAMGVALTAATARIRYASAPTALALLGLVFDFVLVKLLNPRWDIFSFGLRMLEGAHSASLMHGQALSWWSSIVYFLALGAGGAMLGGRALQQADL